ncbi:MAG: efflux RND transporter periplasmic adaptor subunit [Bacillota bacterium]|nr:efflux RND transporter periplasmic adaptor subunit [Bacillota bacterium]
MSKIKNKKKLIIILIVIIALGAFTYSRFIKAKEQVALETQINQIEHTVERGSIKKSITGSGSIESSDSRTILSGLEGTIDEIYVEEGQKVNEDELLAIYELESDSSEELTLETQKFNLLKSQSNLRDLYEKNQDLNIYAEISGTVRYFVEEGEEVNQNIKIAELNETDVIYFKSHFTENQIDSMKVGDKAEIFINSSLISLDGEITEIDKTPIPTGSNSIGYMVKGKINYNGILEEGSRVKVTAVTNSGTFVSPYSGEITKSSTVDIYPTYSGEINTLKLSSGDSVEKGQLIMTLKSEDLDMEIAQQELNVDKNRLELENLTEEDSTITSPINGTILTVLADEQGYVEKGKQLFQVADLENMEVIISVDELDIINVSKGQSVTIQSEVFAEEEFKGEVKSISLKGSNQSGVTTYDVTITLNDRKQLMSGMNVDVEILIEEKNNALIIPIESVSKVGNKYIINKKDDEGNLTPVSVEVGITNDSFIEVTSGLSEGDKIYYTTETSQDFPDGIMMPGMGLGGGQGRSSDGGGKE